MGTSEWPNSVVLNFRTQPNELKRGWTDSLIDNIFCLIGRKTISKLNLLSSPYLYPLTNQHFKPFWDLLVPKWDQWWERVQSDGTETVTGKCTHFLPSLVLWVNSYHQIRGNWKKKHHKQTGINGNVGRTTYTGKWRTLIVELCRAFMATTLNHTDVWIQVNIVKPMSLLGGVNTDV